MIIYRLAREQYSGTLSGAGAARMGARWNSPGVEIIYCAISRALAIAEVAVHLTTATLPDDYMMLPISVPSSSATKSVNHADLLPDWNIFPSPKSTRIFGDSFIRENQFLMLQVPSAVVKGDYNILINPFDKDFEKVKIVEKENFPFDSRLFH